MMAKHKTGAGEEWLAARLELLKAEKELTRRSDELARRSEGCAACTLHAESFDRAIVHLEQRDVTMLCVSRAPLARPNAYKKRMGLTVRWVSSLRSDFNYDFGVPLRPGDGQRCRSISARHGSTTGRIKASAFSTLRMASSITHTRATCVVSRSSTSPISS
jgi:predicted dithiol-disulfide oxidoreductase (DUF899 family)